jgi:uncharacterized cupin superfamily protein
MILKPGMAVGFPSGEANGHHLINHTDTSTVCLEIGDRTSDDEVNYPDDDLIARASSDVWTFTHKDNNPILKLDLTAFDIS